MRHILHLVAFDLKGLRIWLAAFVGVIAVQVGLYAFVPYRSTAWSGFLVGDASVPVLRMALTALMTAALVQRDALVGSTALWRTRAIPRRALLASKLTTLLVALVVPPALVAGAVVLSAGLSAADAMAAAADVAIRQAAVVLAALPLAVVTGTLAHFLIGVGDLFALVGLWALVLTGLRQAWPDAPIGAEVDPTIVTGGVLAVGAAIVVVLQYLSLRTKRSVGVLAAVLVAAAACNWLLKSPAAEQMVMWDAANTVATPDGRLVPTIPRPGELASGGESRITAPPSSTTPLANAVTLDVHPGTLETGQGWDGLPSARVAVTSVFGAIDVHGTPDALLLTPFEIESELTCPGGPTLKWGPRKLGFRQPAVRRDPSIDDQPYRAIRAAAGGVAFEPLSGVSAARIIDLVAIPNPVLKRFADGDPALSARVTFLASRYAVSVALPLRPGTSFTLPSRRVSILSVKREVLGAVVTVRDSMLGWRSSHLGVGVNCLLRNSARHEAVVLRLRFDPSLSTSSARVFAGSGFSRASTLSTETYELRTFWNKDRPGIFQPDDAWLRDAELVVISREELGQITLPLRAEHLRLAAPQGGGA